MDFFKSKAGIVAALICLAVIAAVIWFVMSGENRGTVPEGTLVRQYGAEVTV